MTSREIADRVILFWADLLDINPRLALAVAYVENPSADSLARSKAGAIGIMQVMPTVWLGVFHQQCKGSDLINIETNVCYGMHILKHYLDECSRMYERELSINRCALRKYVGASTPDRAQLYIAAVEEKQRKINEGY